MLHDAVVIVRDVRTIHHLWVKKIYIYNNVVSFRPENLAMIVNILY